MGGEDVDLGNLRAVAGRSFCEWKGAARYWGLVEQPEREAIGWRYPEPNPAYTDLRGCIAFYPNRVECTVDGERVRPQPGHFCGGWVTDELVGPWKGEPGTESW